MIRTHSNQSNSNVTSSPNKSRTGRGMKLGEQNEELLLGGLTIQPPHNNNTPRGSHEGGGVRKAISASNKLLLETVNMMEPNISKFKSSTTSSTSVTTIASTCSGSRMIQRMFVSCTIFVIVTLYHGHQQGISIINKSDRNRETSKDYFLGRFNDLSTKRNEMAVVPVTPITSNGITEASKMSVTTFVQSEVERMVSTGIIIDPCTNMNSDRWLNATRYGNLNHVDDPYLTHDLVQHMILNLPNTLLLSDSSSSNSDGSAMPSILKQTICHDQGRFLQRPVSDASLVSLSPSSTTTLSNDEETLSGFDTRTIRVWAMKLIYLAVHYHQHRLAVPEAVVRYHSHNASSNANQCPTYSPQQLEERYNVGIFDYECPDAKYILMPLGGNGLGSNVRGGMVVGLMIGLITDRIVLFVNNVNGAHYHMNKVWTLASCPRRDYQCFFWPTSPCTVTYDEIKNAYPMTRDDYRKVIKENDQLKHIEEHKVWVFNTPFLPVVSLPTNAGERLYQHALTLISAVSKEKSPRYHSLLMEAVETIRVPDDVREGYNYAAASTKVQHALAFYAMRPNPRNAKELDLIMNHIIPKSFPPETSIGLPIRASDKCIGESECLSFDQHMQVTSAMWRKHIDNSTNNQLVVDPTVVFTTESTSMVKEQQAFVSEDGGAKYPFKFDFLTNTKDVTPDSGFMKDIVYNKDVVSDADSIMLSAMSSLKAQLLPRITIGNCCSNFHTLLNDFLSEGCGAASENTFLCLQEYEDPRLRVCCGWHKKCIADKQKLINAI